MSKSFLLMLMMTLLSTVVLAQKDSCNHKLEGIVLDLETKEPIPFATVRLKGISTHTMTNMNGEFEFKDLCSKKHTLLISCFGYCDSTCNHNHQHGDSPHFYLRKKVEELETVVIEARRNNEEGTNSIPKIELKTSNLTKNPSQTLASKIASVEGVSFVSSGSNVQLPIIHGLYGNRILILNHGLKHGFQNWGVDHAPEIDIASAHSITIIKGASGVRFGPEALGGALLVEPNPLELKKPLSLNVGSAYQTNGRGLSSNFNVAQGFDNFSYYVNGSYTKLGDRHAPDYSLTNSGKEEQSLGAGLRYQLKNFDAKLHYSLVNQNLALLRSSIAGTPSSFSRALTDDEPYFIRPFSYDINEPNQLTNHQLAKAELSWYLGNDNKISLHLGRQLNEREEYDVRRNEEKPIIDLDLTTADYQLEWKHASLFGLTGYIGAQYLKQENRNNPGTGTTAFIPNYNTDRLSFFIVESKQISNTLFEFGLRVDQERNFVTGRETSQEIFSDSFEFQNITASIGTVTELTEHLSFRSNLGSAWRSPNMAELFSFGQHGFRNTFGLLRYYYNDQGQLRTDRVIPFDESGFEVERGYKWINQFDYSKNSSRHVLSIYSHYIENFIYLRPYSVIGTIRGPMPVFIYDQADALFVGFDYSWQENINEYVSNKLGISYLWSRNVEFDEPLINQPPIRINNDVTLNLNDFWKFSSTTINLGLAYTFEQFQAPRTVSAQELIDGTEIINNESEIFDFRDAPDGYFLVNLSSSFTWKQFTASIGVENLFNVAYRDYLNEMRYFADEPGRNLIFSLNYAIGTKTNSNP